MGLCELVDLAIGKAATRSVDGSALGGRASVRSNTDSSSIGRLIKQGADSKRVTYWLYPIFYAPILWHDQSDYI